MREKKLHGYKMPIRSATSASVAAVLLGFPLNMAPANLEALIKNYGRTLSARRRRRRRIRTLYLERP